MKSWIFNLVVNEKSIYSFSCILHFKNWLIYFFITWSFHHFSITYSIQSPNHVAISSFCKLDDVWINIYVYCKDHIALNLFYYRNAFILSLFFISCFLNAFTNVYCPFWSVTSIPNLFFNVIFYRSIGYQDSIKVWTTHVGL